MAAITRDFNTPILNLNGEHMKNEKGEPIMISEPILNSLQLTLPGDNGDDQGRGRLSGKQKTEMIALALRIVANPEEVELSSEDATLIKDRVAKMPVNNHILCYRVEQFIEGSKI